jgi:predicted dehydrogenase
MALAGLTTESMGAAITGISKVSASMLQVSETTSGSRVRRDGTTAMSSNEYALRARLPRPISISITCSAYRAHVRRRRARVAWRTAADPDRCDGSPRAGSALSIERPGVRGVTPVRVAVIGTGGWGAQHARTIVERIDTELVGVVGRDPQRTAARAAAYGTRGYTSIDGMLEAEHPDLVTVCLPNEEHFAPTLALLRARVPLLVEKPLVFDLAEADILLDAAGDTFFAINFNQRYGEPVQRARVAMQAGELGDLIFATWRFGGEANRGPSPHANLIETQCHGFDMLEYLCGPIASVAAQMTSITYGAFSTIAVALEFASGAVGTMLGSYDSSYAYPDTQRVELNGTGGRAVIHDTVRSLTLQSAGDETERVWRAGYFDDEARSFEATFDRHLDALLAALRAGSPPPVPASAGRRALELAHAVIHSHETGARVPTLPATPSSG